jgi:hypothetical protein
LGYPLKQSLAIGIQRTVGSVRRAVADPGESIVVSGTPRSGTSWTAEVIAGATKRPTIWEPLNPHKLPEWRERHGLTFRPYRPADADDPAFVRDLGRLLGGTDLRPSFVKTDMPTMGAFLTHKRVVVKLITGNLLLPFLVRNFPTTSFLALLRDPFAVVASQLRHKGNWKTATGIAKAYEPFLDDRREFRPRLEPRTTEEVLATHWCIEHAYLERELVEGSTVQIVRYENLYRNPKEGFPAMFRHFGEEWGPDSERFLQREDSVAKSVDPGADLATHYRSFLSDEQVQRIAAVLDTYGWPFYKPSEFEELLPSDETAKSLT